MGRKLAGSGGAVERVIFFLIGVVLAAIGTTAAWYSYKFTSDTRFIEHRWLYIAFTSGLAFFMLRGAWFTIFPEVKDERVEFNTGGR